MATILRCITIIFVLSLIHTIYSHNDKLPPCDENQERSNKSCCDECPTNPPTPCAKLCMINACVCKTGFKRDPQTGICIPEGLCKKSCGNNEERVRHYCACSDTCPSSKYCPHYCIEYGCKCKTGYLRLHPGNPCIPSKACPCKKNEVLGTKCPCKENCPGPVAHNCADAQCYPNQCTCKQGYLRNMAGCCIPKDNCPNLKG